MFKRIHRGLQDPWSRRRMMALGMFVAFVLIIVLMRVWDAIILRYKTNERAVPLVHTVTAVCAPLHDDIILPGNVMAWHEAPIYARTSGYVKQWYVDIGYHVKKGDLLALIETPELDAQLRAAQAQLAVVMANDKLAQTTAARWIHLLKTDSVSKQETDEKVDTATALKASVVAARAERDRLRELVGFERVIAPFTGIISKRTTDIGTLVNAGSNPDEQYPLFHLVKINPLRVYVKIPETYSSRIKPNMTVSLRFAEHPGQRFSARLLKTAQAIDPKTRTLLAQFIVQNKKGVLMPGSYTEMHFAMPTYPEAVRIPINTLLFRKEGLQVATLGKDNHVRLKNIRIHRDFGNDVEIASGLCPGERVILNPADSIYHGELVRVVDLMLAGEPRSSS